MDTKLKNSKLEKLIINLIAVMLVLISSIGMIVSYPTIDKIAKEKESKNNYFESYRFAKIIKGMSYKAYYDIYDDKGGSTKTPFEVLAENDANNNEKDEYDISEFNDEVNTFTQDNLNLDYFAINTKDKISTSNMEKDIKVLENGSIDVESINKDKYQFYTIINFDNLGRASISSIYGSDKYELIQNINNEDNYIFDNYCNLIPLKNMSFVFGISKDLKYHDNIYWGIENFNDEVYGVSGLIFILIGIIFIILSALLIPYNRAKDIISFKLISKTPFEVVCILLVLNISLNFAALTFMISECISGVPGNFIGTINVNSVSNVYYLINFIVWMIIFAVYFNTGLLLKHIFKIGVKKYFITTTFVGLFVSFIGRYIKKTILELSEIDLKEKNNKVILKVVLINALILSLICMMWFFGIIAVIIYSVAIFFIIRKYADGISSKYNTLTEATKKIAQGNLDVKIEEDLGLFEPLKDDLERIQQGFKKAVEEEVKSQKMKTELISNVSHDLKTPLTSIITYVDLLKDENLSKEKRTQYLDILDKKSQRLQYLIEDLFEVSKASSGNISLNIENVDVVSLMKQTLLELEDKILQSKLIIKKNLPEDKIILCLDSQRTFRVFENLVLNITKYAMPNTRVYIDILDKNDFVEIVLKNMTADEINFDVEQIVERFVRGDKSRNTEGSGLGLAIAKSFVELQGGSLKVEIDGDLFKVIIKFIKLKA